MKDNLEVVFLQCKSCCFFSGSDTVIIEIRTIEIEATKFEGNFICPDLRSPNLNGPNLNCPDLNCFKGTFLNIALCYLYFKSVVRSLQLSYSNTKLSLSMGQYLSSRLPEFESKSTVSTKIFKVVRFHSSSLSDWVQE